MIEASYEFLKGRPIFIPILEYVDSDNAKEYFALDKWEYSKETKHVEFKVFDPKQQYFKYKKGIQDGDYRLRSIHIYVDSRFVLPGKLEKKAISGTANCEELIRTLLVPRVNSYCNHDNELSICYNNQFAYEKDKIEEKCGKTYEEGKPYTCNLSGCAKLLTSNYESMVNQLSILQDTGIFTMVDCAVMITYYLMPASRLAKLAGTTYKYAKDSMAKTYEAYQITME